MSRLRRLVAILWLVLLSWAVLGCGGSSAASPPAGPPAKPMPAPEEFGASVNWLFNAGIYPPTQIEARLHDLRLAGATIARTDALWELGEPRPPARGGRHAYDWTFDDQIAFGLAAVGLRWLPILDYTATWDRSVRGQDHSPPRSPADFAAFAGALAARYGPGGPFWRLYPGLPPQPVQTLEVWNEPDLPQFWAPKPDAAKYAGLYVRARNAITAADPAARVIVGGLTNPAAFLPALLRARPDLRGHVDGVAIHPYGPNIFGVLGFVRTARQTLQALRMGSVPLYVTEVGWTTHPVGTRNYAPSANRPGYISSTLAALGHTNCQIAATVVYSWVTPQSNLSNREDWFGLEPPGGGATPATAAFTSGIRQATSPAGALKLC